MCSVIKYCIMIFELTSNSNFIWYILSFLLRLWLWFLFRKCFTFPFFISFQTALPKAPAFFPSLSCSALNRFTYVPLSLPSLVLLAHVPPLCASLFLYLGVKCSSSLIPGFVEYLPVCDCHLCLAHCICLPMWTD